MLGFLLIYFEQFSTKNMLSHSTKNIERLYQNILSEFTKIYWVTPPKHTERLHQNILNDSTKIYWATPPKYTERLHQNILSDSIKIYWAIPSKYSHLQFSSKNRKKPKQKLTLKVQSNFNKSNSDNSNPW